MSYSQPPGGYGAPGAGAPRPGAAPAGYGAPAGAAPAQYGTQQYGTQQYGTQQYGTQQYGAPAGGASYQSQQQYGAPQGYGQPSGYGAPQQQQQWYGAYTQGLTPQEAQQISQWFGAVDTDRSGQIDAQELHKCLSFGGHNFSFQVTQKILQAFDTDRSGQIGLNEFIAMHKYLQAMRDSFMFFDRDRSNSLDTNELLQALNRAGYNISQPALMAALPKFDKDRNGTLGFDEFLDLCIYLSNIRKLFSFYDPQNTGRITLTFDQLFACSPYFQ